MARTETQLEVDGRTLRMRNLDKVLYPATGFTKGDVVGYYTRIAPVLLPHLRGRPLMLKRYPDGVEGPHFYEKACPDHRPEWVHLAEVPANGRTIAYCTVDDLASLVWVAGLASLELHPLLSRVPTVGQPDLLVFDLDPGPPAGMLDAARVALVVRDALERLGLRSVVRSSGSKGVHVLAGLSPDAPADEVKHFARQLAVGLERVWPDVVVSSMRRSTREGKVLVDWGQNDRHKSTVASYSLRAGSRPTVAAPVTWDELDDALTADDAARLLLSPAQVLERVERLGDLHAELLGAEQRLPAPPDAPPARLSTYRTKRRFERTPEPVGAAPASAPSAATRPGPAATAPARFVIQEHDATRLHWDLRLEHEGVLRSWALPRGVPWSPGQDRLAVHTEDHPLEYLAFEGEIPAGGYGAGTMTIFDEGTYEPITVRDDKVVVRLDGVRVQGRFALFPLRGRDWMIHRMDPPQDRSRHPLPASLLPMDAAPGRLPPPDDDLWWFEPWWPGRRVTVANDAGHLTVRGAGGEDLSDAFPELAGLGRRLAWREVLLDGVVTGRPPARGAGRGSPLVGLDREPVERRLATSSPGVLRRLREAAPVQLIVVDLLWYEGHPLLAAPLEERRARLDALVPAEGAEDEAWSAPRPVEGDGRDLLAVVEGAGLPGVIAKRRDSRYRPGATSRSWRRIAARPRGARP